MTQGEGDRKRVNASRPGVPDRLFHDPEGVTEILNLHAPHLAGLAATLLPALPPRVRASANLRTHCRAPHSALYALGPASTLPWVCVNSRKRLVALLFDVDHAEGPRLAAELQERFGLRRPVVIQDPWSGRSHVVVLLTYPLHIGRDASSSLQLKIRLAHRLLAIHLRATPLPHGSHVKWPWGRLDAVQGHLRGRCAAPNAPPPYPDLWAAYERAGTGLVWHTDPGTGPVTLNQVVDALKPVYGHLLPVGGKVPTGTDTGDPYLPDDPDAAGPPRLIADVRVPGWRTKPKVQALGRNCVIFDLVRYWAYARVERDADAILQEAQRLNTVETYVTYALPQTNPLQSTEVADVARSIARFMVERYTGGPRVPPRDWARGFGLDAEGKRRLAGQTTATRRHQATEDRIRVAHDSLVAEGLAPTLTAVAVRAEVSRATVARHRMASKLTDNGHERPARVADASASGFCGTNPPKGAGPALKLEAPASRSPRLANAATALLAVAGTMIAHGRAPDQRRLALAAGVSLRTVRRHVQAGLLASMSVPVASSSPSSDVLRRRTDERVRDAVDAVPQGGQPVSLRMIATQAGVSVATVRSRLGRILPGHALPLAEVLDLSPGLSRRTTLLASTTGALRAHLRALRARGVEAVPPCPVVDEDVADHPAVAALLAEVESAARRLCRQVQQPERNDDCAAPPAGVTHVSPWGVALVASTEEVLRAHLHSLRSRGATAVHSCPVVPDVVADHPSIITLLAEVEAASRRLRRRLKRLEGETLRDAILALAVRRDAWPAYQAWRTARILAWDPLGVEATERLQAACSRVWEQTRTQVGRAKADLMRDGVLVRDGVWDEVRLVGRVRALEAGVLEARRARREAEALAAAASAAADLRARTVHDLVAVAVQADPASAYAAWLDARTPEACEVLDRATCDACWETATAYVEASRAYLMAETAQAVILGWGEERRWDPTHRYYHIRLPARAQILAQEASRRSGVGSTHDMRRKAMRRHAEAPFPNGPGIDRGALVRESAAVHERPPHDTDEWSAARLRAQAVRDLVAVVVQADPASAYAAWLDARTAEARGALDQATWDACCAAAAAFVEASRMSLEAETTQATLYGRAGDVWPLTRAGYDARLLARARMTAWEASGLDDDVHAEAPSRTRSRFGVRRSLFGATAPAPCGRRLPARGAPSRAAMTAARPVPVTQAGRTARSRFHGRRPFDWTSVA